MPAIYRKIKNAYGTKLLNWIMECFWKSSENFTLLRPEARQFEISKIRKSRNICEVLCDFYWNQKQSVRLRNVYVINLAFCEFLMMSKVSILIHNSFHQGMALGPIWCEYDGLVGSISGVGAEITNAFIAYDRCVLVLPV